MSPQSHATEEGLQEPADSSFTTQLTTGLSTADTNETTTVDLGIDVTDDNPNPSYANYTRINVTSSPAMHTDPNDLTNSTSRTVQPEGIFSIKPEEPSTFGNITGKYESPSTTQKLNTGAGTVAKGNNYLIFHR